MAKRGKKKKKKLYEIYNCVAYLKVQILPLTSLFAVDVLKDIILNLIPLTNINDSVFFPHKPQK